MSDQRPPSGIRPPDLLPALFEAAISLALDAPLSVDAVKAAHAHLVRLCPADAVQVERALDIYSAMASGASNDSPATFDDLPNPTALIAHVQSAIEQIRRAGGTLFLAPLVQLDEDSRNTITGLTMVRGIRVTMTHEAVWIELAGR